MIYHDALYYIIIPLPCHCIYFFIPWWIKREPASIAPAAVASLVPVESDEATRLQPRSKNYWFLLLLLRWVYYPPGIHCEEPLQLQCCFVFHITKFVFIDAIGGWPNGFGGRDWGPSNQETKLKPAATTDTDSVATGAGPSSSEAHQSSGRTCKTSAMSIAEKFPIEEQSILYFPRHDDECAKVDIWDLPAMVQVEDGGNNK